MKTNQEHLEQAVKAFKQDPTPRLAKAIEQLVKTINKEKKGGKK